MLCPRTFISLYYYVLWQRPENYPKGPSGFSIWHGRWTNHECITRWYNIVIFSFVTYTYLYIYIIIIIILITFITVGTRILLQRYIVIILLLPLWLIIVRGRRTYLLGESINGYSRWKVPTVIAVNERSSTYIEVSLGLRSVSLQQYSVAICQLHRKKKNLLKGEKNVQK